MAEPVAIPECDHFSHRQWRCEKCGVVYVEHPEVKFPEPAASPVAGVSAPEGTYSCPICGSAAPHAHSPKQIAEWRASEAAANDVGTPYETIRHLRIAISEMEKREDHGVDAANRAHGESHKAYAIADFQKRGIKAAIQKAESLEATIKKIYDVIDDEPVDIALTQCTEVLAELRNADRGFVSFPRGAIGVVELRGDTLMELKRVGYGHAWVPIATLPEIHSALRLAQPSAEGDGWIAVSEKIDWKVLEDLASEDELCPEADGQQEFCHLCKAIKIAREVLKLRPAPVAKEGRES